ncbi:MAG: lipopolysaccharide biosynthesis protein [bacterium]
MSGVAPAENGPRIGVRSNLVANQVGFVLPVLVTFFLSPYVVRTLGDTWYGLWSLIVSLTGHYSMLTLGVQSATTRYLAWAAGQGDATQTNRYVNAALWMLLPAAALCLLLGGVITGLLDSAFNVPAEHLRVAQFACLLVAVTSAVNFASATFSCILTAHQRFDTLNLVRTSAFVLRSALTFVLLLGGFGIVALAVLGLVVMAATGAAFWVLARVQVPGWSLSRRWVERESFRTLVAYGVKSFVGIAAQTLTYHFALLIIGVFMRPADITVYALASGLLYYVVQFVNAIVHVVDPYATQRYAREGVEGVRDLFLDGSAFMYVVGGSLVAGAVVFARPFFALWIDPEHAHCGTILVLLIVPQFFNTGSRFGHSILVAMAKIGKFNAMTLAGAIASVVLGIVLVRPWGTTGVAVGALVPMVVVDAVWFVPFIAGLLGEPAWRVWRRSIAKGLLVFGVGLAVGEAVARSVPPATWGGLALGAGLTAAACIVTGILVLPAEIGEYAWKARLRRPLWPRAAEKLG